MRLKRLFGREQWVFMKKKIAKKEPKKLLKQLLKTKAYKIIAGGDTAASIENLGLENKIDFVCSGGGVMLEMLVKKDLPAWS